MRTKSLLFTLLSILTSAGARGQTFQDFIEQLNITPDSLRQSVVDSFVVSNPVSPVLEADTLAHYYYLGTPGSVTVPGDANQWNPSSWPMTSWRSSGKP